MELCWLGWSPLLALPARAPFPNSFSLFSKPFACHTSKNSRVSPATATDPKTDVSKSCICHTSEAPGWGWLCVNFSLGPIGGVDPHVLRGEVAGPIAGLGFAGVQIHNQWNVLGEKFVAGGALVEIERLATPQHGDASHLYVHKRRIKLNSG